MLPTRYTLHIQTDNARVEEKGGGKTEHRTPPNAHASLYNKLCTLVPVARILQTARTLQAAV